MAGPSEILEVHNTTTDDIMYSEYGYLVPIQNKNLMKKAILKLISTTNFKSKYEKITRSRALNFEYDKILNLYKTTFEKVK